MKNIIYILLSTLLTTFLWNCSSSKKQFEPSQVRHLSPSEISSYHNAVNMRIGWMPYEDIQYQRAADNRWVLIESDAAAEGMIPVIMISYPETGDSLWFNMNMKSETLGKLLKHTMMTQKPIYEPVASYLADAKCTSCHPSDVRVNFDW